MKLGIIIPTHNRRTILLKCLEALHRDEIARESPQIFVVFDGCSDGSEEEVRIRFPHVHQILGDGNLWWSGAINAGFRAGLELNVTHFLLLNDDVYLDSSAPRHRLASAYCHPGAVIGSKILFADDPRRIWCAGGSFDWWKRGLYMSGNGQLDGPEYRKSREVDWFPGMGSLIPAEVVKRLEGIDERAFPHYFGDSDFGLRARRAGIRLVLCPESILHNDVSLTGFLLKRGSASWSQLRDLFFSLRSHAHLKTRFRFWLRHCPIHLVPWQAFRFYAPIGASILKSWLMGLKRRITLKNQA